MHTNIRVKCGSWRKATKPFEERLTDEALRGLLAQAFFRKELHMFVKEESVSNS